MSAPTNSGDRDVADKADADGWLPASYLPAALSAPAWLVPASFVSFAATDAPALWPYALAAIGIGLGAVLRRLSPPTPFRAWLAQIGAVAGFLAGLLATLNVDSSLMTAGASAGGAVLGYTIVMAARPEALSRRHPEK